jgi:hypothetical protein
MEAAYYSEISADFYRTTRRYIPEARTLYSCDNLKSYILNYCLLLRSFIQEEKW